MHDISDGGLAVALAEMAMASGIGADVSGGEGFTQAQWWFGEDQGRYVITVPDTDAFNRALAKGTENDETAAVGFTRIGTTGGDSLLGVEVDAAQGRPPQLLQSVDGSLARASATPSATSQSSCVT